MNPPRLRLLVLATSLLLSGCHVPFVPVIQKSQRDHQTNIVGPEAGSSTALAPRDNGRRSHRQIYIKPAKDAGRGTEAACAQDQGAQ